MTTVVDPEEKVTAVVYDMVGNVTSITTPGERTTTYGYDKNYNNVSVTDPMGYVYGYSFDKDDRLSGTTDPLKQTTTYTYDGANRLTALKDKMGLTESFVYDAHGNVVNYTATDGLVTGYTYDLKNRLTSVTDPMGSTAYYTYDVMDNLTAVTDYMGRGTSYTYDVEGNMLSITDAAGRKETMTYDVAGRITSYTSNGGNRIIYDYDKLDNLVEKSYQDAKGKESAEPVKYAYDALGQRINMYDSTGETAYTYDGLGRITSVTTYRSETGEGDVIGYTYDTADNLSAIIYPDGTKVSYEYDKNDNLIKVTDRDGQVTTYVYDALNRITEIHRPNGVSTYNTYNARDQIVELTNICDDCEWVVSKYSYTYDERGFIVAETAIESLAGYAYDDKHNGKHADGKHDDLYPHGTKHNKHDKDATFAYQIVQTDRTFTYDDAGKLLSATEIEDNYGTYVYTYEYDLMGNRTAVYKKDSKGKVVESEEYSYNKSNQVEKVTLYDGKKNTTITYSYDKDGNRISEIGKIGTDKVEKYYEYTVENRLAAVYDKDELLIAMAYDGDGNRVFQLNYNLHTDEDGKGNSGNGNGNNKDNKGSGNNGKGSSNNGKGNSKSKGTDDAGYGNATNAEEHNSQNQSGILFPIDEEVSETEQSLIDEIKTSGKQKNYELIEYLNDVNREYVEVLVEQNINGKTDTSYVYGVNRLSRDRFDGSTGYYLYDPRGSVTGITNEEGQIYQSYRYSATGEITFGAPQYENEYTYNGESYNPNIESQYLRARYYNVVNATFLTEDSYLGNINEPLTLNRYNYCVSSYLNYQDPSGNIPLDTLWDLACTGWDAIQYLIDPSDENRAILALDAAAILAPYVPAGSGRVAKAVGRYFNKGVDIVETIDDAGKIRTIGMRHVYADIYEPVFDTSKIPALLPPKQSYGNVITYPPLLDTPLNVKPFKNQLMENAVKEFVEEAIIEGAVSNSCESGRYSHTQNLDGLNEVRRHLTNDVDGLDFEPNKAMMNKIEEMLSGNQELTGAYKDFYEHELTESMLMQQGHGYNEAHNMALEIHNVQPQALYSPEIVQEYSKWFNKSDFEYWGIIKK